MGYRSLHRLALSFDVVLGKYSFVIPIASNISSAKPALIAPRLIRLANTLSSMGCPRAASLKANS
jgi:hypothetical protein